MKTKTNKKEQIDWTSLDRVTTFHVNSNVNKVFSNLAQKNGTSRAALLRNLMIEYIRENHKDLDQIKQISEL